MGLKVVCVIDRRASMQMPISSEFVSEAYFCAKAFCELTVIRGQLALLALLPTIFPSSSLLTRRGP
jgi:hypothetical protein